MNNHKLDIELYGFSGKSGVGKNYIAETLFVDKLTKKIQKNTLIMAFADHIKIDMCIKNNFNYDDVYYNKNEDTRKAMQIYGTENGRDKYGENIWLDALAYWMQTYYDRGIRRFIITDVRFENEMMFVKKCGGTNIYISAPNRINNSQNNSGTDLHVSENSINTSSVDYIINNDTEVTQEQLSSSIDDVINEIFNKSHVKILK